MSKQKNMRLAIKLAEKGTPSPNPFVGAVIVNEKGEVIGKGFHKRAGMPHAEIEALKSLANPLDARGATMYVTLEPCNHFGRTPPCTKAIVEAGIAKVVFALEDPNPTADGGEEELRKHDGIVIEKGVLKEDAAKLNEVFLKNVKQKAPFVVLKAAMTLDGKIATRTGDSKWITGEKSRKLGYKLRSKYDCILVGIGTVLADDSQLTSRVRGGKNPLRVVLDGELKTPLNAKVLADKNFVIATTQTAVEKGENRHKVAELEKKGGKIIACGAEKNGANTGDNRIDLQELLKKLFEMGVTSVLVEGGSEVHGSFVDERLFDKIVLFVAPKIAGGRKGKGVVGGQGASKIADAINLSKMTVKKIGGDFVFEGYPDKS